MRCPAFRLTLAAFLICFLLPSPARAALDLLVASWGTHEIIRYDGQTGAFIDVFASGGDLFRPSFMTVGPDGNLYVSKTQFQNHAVLRYDGVTGESLGVFASDGVHGPRGLDFGPDGNLYVTRSPSVATSGRINRYDGQTGALIDSFVDLSSPGNLVGAFNITFGPDDNLYSGIGTNGADFIFRYDGQSGNPIDTFVNAGHNRFIFGPDGNLYVSDGSVITRYDGQTGDFIDTFINGVGGLDSGTGFEFGPDGNLYVSNASTDEVLRYDGQTGAFLDVFASGGGLDVPTALVFIPEPSSSVLLFFVLTLIALKRRKRTKFAS